MARTLCAGSPPRGMLNAGRRTNLSRQSSGKGPGWRPGMLSRELAQSHLHADIRPTELAGSLSIAQQQIVVIAQALSIKAKLVIMDEPTSALSKQESERLFETIRQLKAQGITIIYVSHRLEEVFGIADRITALRDGRHVGTLLKSEATPEHIVRMMVGREITNLFPKERHRRGVDSELTCPVLVAHQMSASSGSVLLWDCGQRLGVVHISTGTPPSGFKRRFSHPGSLPSRRTGRCSAARGRGHGIRRDRRGP